MKYKILSFSQFLNEAATDDSVKGAVNLTKDEDVKDIDLLLKDEDPNSVDDSKAGTVSVDFGNEFKSGRYRFDESRSKELQKRLARIGRFIKANASSDLTIKIDAKESQVTNKDFETGEPLAPGELSKKRADVTKQIIEDFLKSLQSDKTFTGTYTIDITTGIGSTPYKKGEDVNQKKFTDEQYVRVSITAKENKNKYLEYSKRGERVYDSSSKHAIADIYYMSRKSNSVTDSGVKNTGYENVLMKTIDKNGYYDGRQFLIPWDWWNKTFTSSSISADSMDYIQKNYKI